MKSYMNIAAKSSSSTSRHISLLGVILILLITATSSLAQVTYGGYTSTTGDANNFTINKPTSTAAGDLLIVAISIEKGTEVTSLSFGGSINWILLESSGSTDFGMRTYYRFAGASEPTTYSFTFKKGSGNLSSKYSASITRFTGVNTTTPIQVKASSSSSDNSSTTVTAPKVTTTVNNTYIALFFANKKNSTYTPGDGIAEKYDGIRSDNTSLMMAEYVQGTAGDAGPFTATASEKEWSSAHTIALNAAPPPAPTLTTVSPNSGIQGQNVNITLTGTNFQSGATVAVSGTGVTVSDVNRVSSSSITATFTIGASALTGGRNVTVTTAGGTTSAQTFTVNAAPPPVVKPSNLTYSGTNAFSYTYGTSITTITPTYDGDPATSFSVTPPLPTGLSFSTSTGAISGNPEVTSAESSYVITATNSAGSANVTVKITVGKRAITITPTADQSKVYGASDPTIAYTASTGGLAFSDTFQGNLAREVGENVNEYIILIGDLKIVKSTAPNKVVDSEIQIVLPTPDVSDYYDITLAEESFEITPATLTISGTISAKNKVYDGTTDAELDLTGVSLSGIVFNDDDVSLATPVGTFNSANVGDAIPVISGLTLTGADAGNYSLSQPIGLNADITPAPLYVIPDTGQFKFFGEQDPVLTYQVSESQEVGKITIPSFQLNGVLGREKGEDVGEYDFTLGTLELTSTNYELELVENAPMFSIRTASTKITLDENADIEFVYNGNPQGLSNQISVNGSTSTPILIYNGRNGTSFGPSLIPPGDVGNYSVTVIVAADINFDGAEAGPFNFVILPKMITIGGGFTAVNKMFDGNTNASFSSNNLTLTGVISSDQNGVSLSNVGIAFDNAFINTPQTVRIVSASLSGARAGQYLLSLEEAPTATASITYVYFNVNVKVFEDLNANDVMDTGDTGLSGRTVTLSKGSYTASGQTDAQGNVSFELENAEPGQYTLSVVEPDGWVNVSSSKVIDFNSSLNQQTASFGQFRPAKISGLAYLDRNNNDLYDDGDEVYSGLNILLTTPEGGLIKVKSGSDGRYSFEGIRPSERVLSAENPSETLIVTFPYAPSEYQISLNSGDGLEDVNFALAQPTIVFGNITFENITVSTTTMQSVVVRGYRTGPSPTKVAIPLTLPNSQQEVPVIVGQPNGDGSFVFPGVKPGQYRIELSLPIELLDVNAKPMMVNIKKDESVEINLLVSLEENMNEALVASASLRGFIYADINGNALWDGTDKTTLPDVTVYLEGSTIRGEKVMGTTITDVKGEYHFTQLKPGTYTVQLGTEVNYRVSIPGNNLHHIQLNRFENLGKSPFVGTKTGEPIYVDKTPMSFTLYMDWDRDGTLDERVVMSGRFEVELAGTTEDKARPLRNIRLQANGKLLDGRSISAIFPSVLSGRGTFTSTDKGFDVQLHSGITITVGSEVYYSDDRLSFKAETLAWPIRSTYLVADHFEKGLLMRDPFGRPSSSVLFVSLTPLYGYDFGIENADYGDAPVSYGTIKNLANDKTGEPFNGCINYPNDGARHVVPMQGAAKLYLGNGVSGDRDGKPSAQADGDTDDGVVMSSLLQIGTEHKMQIKVFGRGYLNAWADWNGNGVFDSNEQIITDLLPEPSQTLIDVSVNVPADALADTSYIRFRYSSVKGLASRGWVKDGEVEDFMVVISASRVSDGGDEGDDDGNTGTPTSDEDDHAGLPTSFALGKNYPNPFNPTTVIPFDLAAAGQVNIAVYDITGRLVKQLVSETMRAGRHTVTFNATGIPSGVYMVRMSAGGQVFSGKVALVK